MFVLCVLRGKDRWQSAGQSGQRSKGKVQSENKKKSPCRGRFFCSSKRHDCLGPTLGPFHKVPAFYPVCTAGWA